MDIFWMVNQLLFADAERQVNYYQNPDLHRKADHALNRAEHSNRLIAELDEKVDQLALKCQALWEIVKKETSLSDDDIRKKIHEIDMRDGTSDGKIRESARKCQSCGRAVGKRYNRCIYCGEPGTSKEVFEI